MNLKQKYNLVSKKGLYTRMKCFSIDLDGTLLNSSHQIPEENFKVLQDLQAQGHTIIINTGRAVEDVIKFEEIQKLQAPIISINGTVIYSSTQEVLYEASLPVETYKEILPILQDIGLWVMVYTNQGGFPCRNPEIQDKSDDDIEPIFANYDYNQILEKENLKIYKVMAVSRHDELEKIDNAKQAIDGNFEFLGLHHIRIMSNSPQLKQIKEGLYYAIKSLQIPNLMRFSHLETVAMILNSLKWPQPLLPWKMLLLRLNKKRM